ncbi:MAG: CBS domain-containing protein [Cellvibrionaceae bacterium]|nr:CBS domain-containing protein [Cellvibrionaceae bacterium]
MPVAEIMTRKLITVSPELSIAEIQPMFTQFHLHHLLVVEEENCSASSRTATCCVT